MKINNKVKLKIFKTFIIILFIIFVVLYFSEASGYYEFQNRRTKELTDKQITKFEQDIAKGKNVKIEDYIVTKDNDYSNNLSNAGYSISKGISSIVEKGLNNTFSVIIKLIEE